MGSEWQQAFLTDLYDIGSGLSKPAGDFGSGYPFLSFKDVFYNVFVPAELGQLVQSDEKEQQKCSVRRGDVFLTRTSETMNELGMSSVALKDYPQATFNGFTKRLRPKAGNSLVPEYVAYYLRSPVFRTKMLAFSTMSTRASLNNEMISRLTIDFPTPAIQSRIAGVLKAFDNKIALNRQINTTLESMAQALFKSWFVDFDPVIDNALAAGHEIPDELQARADRCRALLSANTETAAARLPQDIQQLFPDRFVFTEEMGWVPEGWEVASISRLADLNPEAWSNKNHPDSIKYVDLANAKNGRIDEVITYSFADAPSRARRVLRKDDTIFGTVRPGNRSFALIHEDGLTGSTGFAVLRPKFPEATAFIYLSVTRQEVIDLFAHLADGAAYPAIRPDVVADHVVVVSPEKLMGAFNRQVMPMLASIGDREAMNIVLANLRDSLLPKLLSGQLSIPEAEQQLAEVL